MNIPSYFPRKSSLHQMTGDYLNGFEQIQSGKKLDVIGAIMKIASYLLFAGLTYITAYILWLATKPNHSISQETSRNSHSIPFTVHRAALCVHALLPKRIQQGS